MSSRSPSSRKRNRHLAVAAHTLQCPTCGFEATSLSQLNMHMEWHVRMSSSAKKISSLTCSVCGFVAASKSVLAYHMKTHTIKTTFKCPECDYTAEKSSELARHLNEIHGKIMCPIAGCGHVAGDKNDFAEHAYKHTKEYYGAKGGRRARTRKGKARRVSRNPRGSSRRK